MTDQNALPLGPAAGGENAPPKAEPYIDAAFRDAEPASDAKSASPKEPGSKERTRFRWAGWREKPGRPAQRVRRVGTFTLGICLIAAGAAIVLSAFFPQFDIVFAAKLAPLSLVLFGVEVAASSMFFAKDKLKYDLFGGFICIVLVGASAAAAVLPAIYEYAGPPHHQLESRLTDEVYSRVLGVIDNPDAVEDLHVSLYLQEGKRDQAMTPAELTSSDYLSLYLSFRTPFESENEFSEACHTLLSRLKDEPFFFHDITFSAADAAQETLTLSISGRLQQSYSAGGLSQLVERH